MKRGTHASTSMTLEEFEYRGELLCLEVGIEADVSAYYPAVMYLRNGDPGYPAEGGEIEDVTFSVGAVVTENGDDWADDRVKVEQQELVAAVEKWYEQFHNMDVVDGRIYDSCAPDDPPELD